MCISLILHFDNNHQTVCCLGNLNTSVGLNIFHVCKQFIKHGVKMYVVTLVSLQPSQYHSLDAIDMGLIFDFQNKYISTKMHVLNGRFVHQFTPKEPNTNLICTVSWKVLIGNVLRNVSNIPCVNEKKNKTFNCEDRILGKIITDNN